MSDESRDVPEEFAEWTKLGNIAGQSQELSAELLEELTPWIDAGRVKVDAETNNYFRLLGNKYPIGVNRIDWRGVRPHLAFDVFPIAREVITGEGKEKTLAECRNILLSWFNSNLIDLQERVVWIGDDSNVSLHTTIETLLEFYPLLFSWPQHSYVLPLTGQWCLNYTMEGQLFFGKAENVIAHGCVNLDESS